MKILFTAVLLTFVVVPNALALEVMGYPDTLSNHARVRDTLPIDPIDYRYYKHDAEDPFDVTLENGFEGPHSSPTPEMVYVISPQGNPACASSDGVHCEQTEGGHLTGHEVYHLECNADPASCNLNPFGTSTWVRDGFETDPVTWLECGPASEHVDKPGFANLQAVTNGPNPYDNPYHWCNHLVRDLKSRVRHRNLRQTADEPQDILDVHAAVLEFDPVNGYSPSWWSIPIEYRQASEIKLHYVITPRGNPACIVRNDVPADLQEPFAYQCLVNGDLEDVMETMDTNWRFLECTPEMEDQFYHYRALGFIREEKLGAQYANAYESPGHWCRRLRAMEWNATHEGDILFPPATLTQGIAVQDPQHAQSLLTPVIRSPRGNPACASYDRETCHYHDGVLEPGETVLAIDGETQYAVDLSRVYWLECEEDDYEFGSWCNTIRNWATNWQTHSFSNQTIGGWSRNGETGDIQCFAEYGGPNCSTTHPGELDALELAQGTVVTCSKDDYLQHGHWCQQILALVNAHYMDILDVRSDPAEAGLPYRISPEGNPACASYDGETCQTNTRPDALVLDHVTWLECGPADQHKWKSGYANLQVASGEFGAAYEDNNHWCWRLQSLEHVWHENETRDENLIERTFWSHTRDNNGFQVFSLDGSTPYVQTKQYDDVYTITQDPETGENIIEVTGKTPILNTIAPLTKEQRLSAIPYECSPSELEDLEHFCYHVSTRPNLRRQQLASERFTQKYQSVENWVDLHVQEIMNTKVDLQQPDGSTETVINGVEYWAVSGYDDNEDLIHIPQKISPNEIEDIIYQVSILETEHRQALGEIYDLLEDLYSDCSCQHDGEELDCVYEDSTYHEGACTAEEENVYLAKTFFDDGSGHFFCLYYSQQNDQCTDMTFWHYAEWWEIDTLRSMAVALDQLMEDLESTIIAERDEIHATSVIEMAEVMVDASPTAFRSLIATESRKLKELYEIEERRIRDASDVENRLVELEGLLQEWKEQESTEVGDRIEEMVDKIPVIGQLVTSIIIFGEHPSAHNFLQMAFSIVNGVLEVVQPELEPEAKIAELVIEALIDDESPAYDILHHMDKFGQELLQMVEYVELLGELSSDEILHTLLEELAPEVYAIAFPEMLGAQRSLDAQVETGASDGKHHLPYYNITELQNQSELNEISDYEIAVFAAGLTRNMQRFDPLADCTNLKENYPVRWERLDNLFQHAMGIDYWQVVEYSPYDGIEKTKDAVIIELCEFMFEDEYADFREPYVVGHDVLEGRPAGFLYTDDESVILFNKTFVEHELDTDFHSYYVEEFGHAVNWARCWIFGVTDISTTCAVPGDEGKRFADALSIYAPDGEVINTRTGERHYFDADDRPADDPGAPVDPDEDPEDEWVRDRMSDEENYAASLDKLPEHPRSSTTTVYFKTADGSERTGALEGWGLIDHINDSKFPGTPLYMSFSGILRGGLEFPDARNRRLSTDLQLDIRIVPPAMKKIGEPWSTAYGNRDCNADEMADYDFTTLSSHSGTAHGTVAADPLSSELIFWHECNVPTWRFDIGVRTRFFYNLKNPTANLSAKWRKWRSVISGEIDSVVKFNFRFPMQVYRPDANDPIRLNHDLVEQRIRYQNQHQVMLDGSFNIAGLFAKAESDFGVTGQYGNAFVDDIEDNEVWEEVAETGITETVRCADETRRTGQPCVPREIVLDVNDQILTYNPIDGTLNAPWSPNDRAGLDQRLVKFLANDDLTDSGDYKTIGLRLFLFNWNFGIGLETGNRVTLSDSVGVGEMMTAFVTDMVADVVGCLAGYIFALEIETSPITGCHLGMQALGEVVQLVETGIGALHLGIWDNVQTYVELFAYLGTVGSHNKQLTTQEYKANNNLIKTTISRHYTGDVSLRTTRTANPYANGTDGGIFDSAQAVPYAKFSYAIYAAVGLSSGTIGSKPKSTSYPELLTYPDKKGNYDTQTYVSYEGFIYRCTWATFCNLEGSDPPNKGWKKVDEKPDSVTSDRKRGIEVLAEAPAAPTLYDHDYPNGIGGYEADTRVLANDGNIYECNPSPASQWCNDDGQYYAPGTGSNWQDAWTLIGPMPGYSPDEVEADYAYPDGIGAYVSGTLVSGSNGALYNCVVPSWCNGDGSYYEPGAGLAWDQAWTLHNE